MKLEECRRCLGHSIQFSSSAIIYVDSKPSIEYDIDQWLPEKIKALFIGEATIFRRATKNQPSDTYFYNVNERLNMLGAPTPLLGTISWNIFNLLGIKSSLPKKVKLEQFKKMNCFYSEIVKCRIEKKDRRKLVNRTVLNCNEFLERELRDFHPKVLVVMGKQALFSLSKIEDFSKNLATLNLLQLTKQTAVKPIIINNTKVFFCPLPLWHNRKHLIDILSIFSAIKKEII